MLASERFRKALPQDSGAIFRMGFDVWGAGQTLDSYLEGCRASPKYRRGTWYVLADETTLYSTLIRYPLAPDTCGIGSIATPPTFRKRGYASRLITEALALFESEGFKKTFLFSEIDPRFYERFGFIALPQRHQRHEGSVCMIRGEALNLIERDAGFQPPEYF